MADGVFHTSVGSLFSVTTWILPSCSSESDLSCLGLSAGWGAFTDEEASPRAKLGDARQQTTIAAKTRREPTGANACSSETQQEKLCIPHCGRRNDWPGDFGKLRKQSGPVATRYPLYDAIKGG